MPRFGIWSAEGVKLYVRSLVYTAEVHHASGTSTSLAEISRFLLLATGQQICDPLVSQEK